MDLHAYQTKAVDWMTTNERGFLWLGMGDGKTVIAATATQRTGVPAVVVGTKRIIEDVWPAELQKWPHLSSLNYHSCTGPRRARERSLSKKPDILGVSYENLVWYLSQRDPTKRPLWIFDEISKMKAPGTLRSRMLRKVRPFERAYGLTATPTMEGHLGLWSQWKSIGGDDRLGRTVTEFRDLFTTPVFKGSFTDYKITPANALRIEKLIADHVFTIDPSERPYRSSAVIVDVPVHWQTVGARDHYQRMHKELIAELDSAAFVVASRGAAMNKCRQIATGFVYDEHRVAHDIDTEKFQAVAEAVEEVQGSQALVFYQFEYEKDVLLDLIPGSQPLIGNHYEAFNRGEISTLVLHPKSCSHGLNLQRAAYGFFCSLPQSGEEYAQSIGRIDRQGQEHTPVVKRFIRDGTVDQVVADLVDGKVKGDREVIQRIREVR